MVQPLNSTWSSILSEASSLVVKLRLFQSSPYKPEFTSQLSRICIILCRLACLAERKIKQIFQMSIFPVDIECRMAKFMRSEAGQASALGRFIVWLMLETLMVTKGKMKQTNKAGCFPWKIATYNHVSSPMADRETDRITYERST